MCLRPKPPCPRGPWQQRLPGEEEKKDNVPSNPPSGSICHPVAVRGLGTSQGIGYFHTITSDRLALLISCSETALPALISSPLDYSTLNAPVVPVKVIKHHKEIISDPLFFFETPNSPCPKYFYEVHHKSWFPMDACLFSVPYPTWERDPIPWAPGSSPAPLHDRNVRVPPSAAVQRKVSLSIFGAAAASRRSPAPLDMYFLRNQTH